MKRKIIGFVLTTLCVGILAGCGNNNGTTNQGTTENMTNVTTESATNNTNNTNNNNNQYTSINSVTIKGKGNAISQNDTNSEIANSNINEDNNSRLYQF